MNMGFVIAIPFYFFLLVLWPFRFASG